MYGNTNLEDKEKKITIESSTLNIFVNKVHPLI